MRYLVVIYAFGSYKEGDTITDPAEIEHAMLHNGFDVIMLHSAPPVVTWHCPTCVAVNVGLCALIWCAAFAWLLLG